VPKGKAGGDRRRERREDRREMEEGSKRKKAIEPFTTEGHHGTAKRGARLHYYCPLSLLYSVISLLSLMEWNFLDQVAGDPEEGLGDFPLFRVGKGLNLQIFDKGLEPLRLERPMILDKVG
jgi:hypothetical protein